LTPLRLATRASPLALWQAHHVASLLQAAHPGLEVELVSVKTTGDLRQDVPVWEMGGRGVFVREVQAAILSGRAEAAVHSSKDLQPVSADGLCLAAVPPRGDPRDVLVGSALADLPEGATVATGSQRRKAQLAAARPDLSFTSLRGNIATRLGKIPPGGAVVVAKAALDRLGLAPEPSEVLSLAVMLPQVGQGAIAVECLEDDEATLRLLKAIDDAPTRTAVEAERAFLAAIGGACDLPVAGHAWLSDEDRLHMEGLLATPDGTSLVRRGASGPASEPALVGRQVALLVLRSGGTALLAAR
jgi:hydroxymethylbilane synthase